VPNYGRRRNAHAGGARAANDGAHAAMTAPTRIRLFGKVARASPPRNAATRSADLMQFLGRLRLYGAGRVTRRRAGPAGDVGPTLRRG
jgi:hypothetical protein